MTTNTTNTTQTTHTSRPAEPPSRRDLTVCQRGCGPTSLAYAYDDALAQPITLAHCPICGDYVDEVVLRHRETPPPSYGASRSVSPTNGRIRDARVRRFYETGDGANQERSKR